MSLARRLACGIARRGPMTIADYMDACLHDPAEGYYAARPRLGEAGDFITAPHVSQMFGELLGLWAAEVWVRLGRPRRLRLVELGPGDGTLMSDVLRAAGQVFRGAGGFLEALDVVLVETSAPLRRRQAAALSAAPAPVRWVDGLGGLSADAPLVILANEFLDCLPIGQAVRGQAGWSERLVGAGADGVLVFQAGGPVRRTLPEAPPGAVAEWSEAVEEAGRAVGALLAAASGAGLFVDYGRDAPGFAGAWGDTLQAVRGHAREGALDNPGRADLTAHVDFPAFLAAAASAGATTAPILTQRAFLLAIGVEARARTLMDAAPKSAALVERQLDRLIGPGQMGGLFKAACVHSPGLAPPGFSLD